MYWFEVEQKIEQLRQAWSQPCAPVTKTQMLTVLDIVEALREDLKESISDVEREVDRKQDDPERSW